MNRANPFARHGTIVTLSVFALPMAAAPARAQSDCNRNSIEDGCDVDCGEPEGPCDVQGCGGRPDCNRNNIPDECDVADATSEDCNGDERPDECDTLWAVFESPALGPFGAGRPQQFVVPTPPLAGYIVEFLITARADLGSDSEEVSVALNGTEIGRVFGNYGHDCPQFPDERWFSLLGAEYNSIVHGTDATFVLTASAAVDPFPALCETFVQLRFEYQAVTDTDGNGSGRPDDCDVAYGISTDCNRNLVPDECELRRGSASDCQPNGVLDECDIDDGTSPDCDVNRVPDSCDLVSGTHKDCQPNDVPDVCDIAEGTSPDCNRNAVPDSCDVASGADRDCQANGVLDSCDLSTGTSQDVSPANGIPDECDNRLVSAIYACDASLPRVQRNTMRLTFSSSIQLPPAGALQIRTIRAGGGEGATNLAGDFIATVEGGNTLKLVENGDILANNTWYTVRYDGSGDWLGASPGAGVAAFKRDYVKVKGDADGSKVTSFLDLNVIFGGVGAASDTDRRDMDGSALIAFFDINLAFGGVDSAAPPKPSGHACTLTP